MLAKRQRIDTTAFRIPSGQAGSYLVLRLLLARALAHLLGHAALGREHHAQRLGVRHLRLLVVLRQNHNGTRTLGRDPQLLSEDFFVLIGILLYSCVCFGPM